MKILATGLTGLIGSRINELLNSEYNFESVSRSTGLDITNSESVQRVVNTSDAEIVLHLAAYTDVKAAELQKDSGEESDAWKVNVVGTENIVRACEESSKKLIFISTDLVFDGMNTPDGGYGEEDPENPLNWYARTKFEGELRVRSMKSPWIVVRPAYPYRAEYSKNDFVRLFMQKLSNNEQLTVLTDRIVSPTFIDDLTQALHVLIQKKATGIFHTVGSSQVSVYEAAQEIAKVFSYNSTLIQTTTRKEFLVNRPPEPFNSSLNNAKITKIGVEMKTFSEGLYEIKRQLETSSLDN